MDVSLGYNLSSPTLGSYAGAGTLLYQNTATNPAVGSQANAIDLGSLVSNQTQLDAGATLTSSSFSNYYSFNFQNDGSSTLKLAFNNTTDTTDLRVQVLDSSGNVVADSDGTADQITAYQQLQTSTGLSADSGQYYVKVSYDDTSQTPDQSYSLSLYSGTTFTAAYQTTALQAGAQAGSDPNSLGIYDAFGATSYTRTATNPVTASPATSLPLGTLVTNQSQLSVASEVNSLVPTEDYNFNLQGNSLKLGFQNNTDTSNLRVQVTDSNGNIIADSAGTVDQQLAYAQLSTTTGLAANPGQYNVSVSYAPGSSTDQSQNYALELYSGATYTASYQTTAQIPASATTNVPVDNTATFATSDATISTRTDYNTINETTASAVNIGWLAANKSQLSLTSQLTEADATDYFGFTFQSGTALKLAFDNQTDTSGLRIQLTDVTGTDIIADNDGTAAQKAAFAALTSGNGLNAQTGQYVVKVSYAPGADKTQAQTYNFQLTSGTTYSASYATTTSAQTISNAILSGTYAGTGAQAASAAYISSIFSGSTSSSSTNIFSALESGASSTSVTA